MYQSIFRELTVSPQPETMFCYNWPSRFESAFLGDNAFNFKINVGLEIASNFNQE